MAGLPLSLAALGKPPLTGGQSLAPAPAAGAGSSKTPDGSVAGYMDPSQGPFECDNCQHFHADSQTCDKTEVIAELGGDQGGAQVDPKGCCNFFEKGQAQDTSSAPAPDQNQG